MYFDHIPKTCKVYGIQEGSGCILTFVTGKLIILGPCFVHWLEMHLF
jgi:hypothetical protein